MSTGILGNDRKFLESVVMTVQTCEHTNNPWIMHLKNANEIFLHGPSFTLLNKLVGMEKNWIREEPCL